MGLDATVSGYIAVSSFLLFTGVGGAAQVVKLAQRTRAWRAGLLERSSVCAGLHPVREIWSFAAFSLFALSGLTRSYLDYFLLGSRLPVILLSTAILWFLSFHGAKGAKAFLRIAVAVDLLIAGMITAAASGYSYAHTLIPLVVDIALGGVSLLLLYGKISQALSMYRERRSHAVSWMRETGLVVKDITGLYYSATVGSELFWVSATHIMSGFSSAMICLAKYRVEHLADRDR